MEKTWIVTRKTIGFVRNNQGYHTEFIPRMVAAAKRKPECQPWFSWRINGSEELGHLGAQMLRLPSKVSTQS